MSALGTRVTTTTQSKLMPKLVDTILNSNVFATRMLAKGKKWNGERQKFPIKWQKGVAGTSFAGFDTFSTAASDTRVNLEFVPKFYETNVALPLDELSANATEERVMNMLTLEVASRSQDMADSIGTIFYQDGTGNGSKDFLGLGAIVDDGTSVATYGSLSRSTYPTLDATKTASGGTLSLAKMSTLANAVSSGSIKTTLGVTTEAVYANYESLLQPQERIAKDFSIMRKKAGGTALNSGEGLIGGTGYTGMFYRNFPILADEKCTTGYLYFLNEDFLDFYALPMFGTDAIKYRSQDIIGNDYSEVEGLGFSWTNFIKPTNAAALIGHVLLGGELISADPKRQGVLTGITGI